MGILGGNLFILSLFLELITAWKVFVKYGEPGWKGLIPFYRDYIEFGKVWNTVMGIIYIFCVIAAAILNEVDSGAIRAVFGVFFGLVCFVLNLIFAIKKARAFNKGAGIAILLIFFPFIGNLVLGFGKATYQKKLG